MTQSEFDHPDFLARLRRGDATAYQRLIRRFHGSLVGTAAAIIGSRAQAEEVVQDSWIAVMTGVDKFEGRSSLSSWLFAIVMNRARTRVARESRTVGLTIMSGSDGEERAVPRERFTPDGHWAEPPKLWDELDPERVIGGRQLWDHVQAAIEQLPAGQKAVIILRDIEQRTAEEACALLNITSENQRVLLHRARGRVRRTIESLIGGTAASAPARPAPTAPAGPTAAIRRAGETVRAMLRRWLAPLRPCWSEA